MSRSFTILPTLLCCMLLGFAAATAAPSTEPTIQRRAIDVRHAEAHFRVTHLFVAPVEGALPILSGELTLQGARPLAVRAVLDPTKIHTGDDVRDADLQGHDWFDTQHFPRWLFVSTDMVPRDATHLVTHGLLTIHGVTVPVSLQTRCVPTDGTVACHAEGDVDRHAFGMQPTRADALIGNPVHVILDVRAVPLTESR